MPLLQNNLLESLSWNGTDYTTIAGTRILQNGCTADQVNLTVTQNQRMPLLQTICSGNFPWNGTDYTTTQAGLKNPKDGCTADQVLNCDCPKPADALLQKKQSVLESLSLGMVLIIQVIKLVQESLKDVLLIKY
jgi:hypothetical protein